MQRQLRIAAIASLVACSFASASTARDLKVLFLGDRGHHQPAERFAQLQPVLARRGIALTYTEKVGDLNKATLARYDGLMIYANIDQIGPAEEPALLEYVAGGGGLVPIHCGSFCFRNSPKYVALVGAQFKRHGTGTFRTVVAEPAHPVMKGFSGFESWDETYVHDKHNTANRTVLEIREDSAGFEPWTWVRTEGKGRVFYTAWGHDARTWGHPGFQNLVERGIRWACGDDPQLAGNYVDTALYVPKMTAQRTDVKPFEYIDVGAKIPNYTPGAKWGTQGRPLSSMQLPLEPEESLKHYVTADDFELRLFAAEPDIGKALAMTWDERGRLWLCESSDYPNNLQEPGQGDDYVRVCEDTNGDGRADKFTIFADKLSIPTSLAFHRGGVIVQNATETLYLKDHDGDGHADERRVLLTGWSAGDTHGGVSNLRYGPDGWFWAMQGYNNSSPGRPAGSMLGARQFGTFRMGFFRFRLTESNAPEVEELEFIRSTNNNTWGLGISEEGLIFGSTANGNPSVFVPIPNRYYEAVRGWSPPDLGGIAENDRIYPITEKVRQVDHHGGFTAAAGHALYTARNYPEAYWNRTAFVCEPTAHLVATFVLEPQGAGFRSHNAWNLVASDDEWAAPIMAEVGPDGNVWVLDWYNYIVQHNPTPIGFTTGNGKAYESDLRDKKHGRIFRVVPKGWQEARSPSLAGAARDQLVEQLKSENLFWRLQARRLLSETGSANVFHATSTRPLANNAQRQLTRLLALADAPPSRHDAEEVWKAINDPAILADGILVDAATCAAARQAHDFLLLAAAESPPAAGGRTFECIARVAEHYARSIPRDSFDALLVKLGASASPAIPAVVEGLSRGWPKNQSLALSPQANAAIGKLLKALPNEPKGRLVTLAERLGSTQVAAYANEISASLLRDATMPELDDARRVAAARQLIGFRKTDVETQTKILDMLDAHASPELAGGVLASLADSEVRELGKEVVAKLALVTPTARTAAVKLLIARAEWTPALLDALDSGAIQLNELSLDQKQALAAHPNRDLQRRAKTILSRSGGLPNPDRQKVVDELLPLTETKGDAAAGKLVFTKQCAKCHMHSGEGQKIGPDLSGMAVHPKQELLVHLLDPSRSVEGNFRVYSVQTDDGRVLSGLLASETKTTVEIIDAEGKRHQLLRDEIETLAASSKSMMPEGFEKQVSREDLVNLLEFLTARGKFFPLDLRRAATIVSTRGMFNRQDSKVERLIFSDWSPKTFAGVPFTLVDPQGDRVRNVILLKGRLGKIPPTMPTTVSLPVNSPATAIHLLSGVSGWGFPLGEKESVTMIVRLHYVDGTSENHPLLNGEHFADYIRRVDVPKSQFAFDLGGRQMRYLAIRPKRSDVIREVEFVKGSDATAPVVMAATVEDR
ncbi:MAG TPA: PVC-type heme-binding CxxCH protein [Pirellulales bacterium]|jgi:hypothetical protein|nr:PVC-type heme-binding CxxCH protein [Pirellulales bacterium]